jgi:hypothetical protein
METNIWSAVFRAARGNTYLKSCFPRGALKKIFEALFFARSAETNFWSPVFRAARGNTYLKSCFPRGARKTKFEALFSARSAENAPAEKKIGVTFFVFLRDFAQSWKPRFWVSRLEV